MIFRGDVRDVVKMTTVNKEGVTSQYTTSAVYDLNHK